MAGTLGQPVKKKKTFAFLKSAPKPKPVLDFDDNGDSHRDTEKDDDDDLALFKRSKNFFPVVVKEQEEVHEATPPPKTTERRHESDDDDDRTPSSMRSSKRRRLSPTPEQNRSWRESTEDLYGATPPRRVSKSPSPSRPASAIDKDTPPYRSPCKATGARRSQTKDSVDLVKSDLLPTPRRSGSNSKPAREVVSLDDDDDPFGVDSPGISPSPRKERTSASSTSRKVSTPAAIVLDSDEDDELAEVAPPPVEDEYEYLIKRAREKEAAAKAAAAALAGALSDGDDDPSAVDEHGKPRKKRMPVVSVKIFIHSRLEEASALKPFGVKRGISQDLGFVRSHFVHWARQQGAPITDELGDQIFLTWKGRRIYNTSTGISLGWPTGEIDAPPRTPGFARNGILLEAWTEEGYERYAAELERQKLIERGELVEEDEEEEAKEQEPQAPKLKLTLKEKDAEPFKSAVHADLQVRILINAYRRQRKIPDDRDIRLRYEGEWLDPQATLEQSDVEDMCTIEVYLK